MQYIVTHENDPRINLAIEEYVFWNFNNDDYLILWSNDDSLIVGKFQNVFQEINIPEAIKQNIPIVRRNSGGGTVFHDKGNLNFTYITDWNPNDSRGYDRFLQPVISALNKAGINAYKNKISDIAVENYKISGNAQTIRKGRILHHGTILFDSNLLKLNHLLKPTSASIESNAVKSVRSPVKNIKEIETNKIENIEDLKEVILYSFNINSANYINLSKSQMNEVKELAKQKYNSWEWNYGMSPAFTLKNSIKTSKAEVDVSLKIEKGVIINCQLFGKGICENKLKLLSLGLENVKYDFLNIKQNLNNLIDIINLEGISSEEMLSLLF